MEDLSARRRDLYLTTQDTTQDTGLHESLKLVVATREEHQTHHLDRAATGIDGMEINVDFSKIGHRIFVLL